MDACLESDEYWFERARGMLAERGVVAGDDWLVMSSALFKPEEPGVPVPLSFVTVWFRADGDGKPHHANFDPESGELKFIG